MKTTKRHFKIFSREIEQWAQKLGMHEWRITVFHKKNARVENARASFVAYVQDRIATIYLEPDWGEGDYRLSDCIIRKSAMHEILHLLFARLTYLSVSRAATQEQIDEEEHALVHRLEALFFGTLE